MTFQKRPIRSAQAISPFGPGALMDFPGPESLLHAGLDALHARFFDPERLKAEYQALLIDNEPDLANVLGVDFFMMPPPWENKNDPDTLPWLRFPRWHQCPTCGLMTKAKLEDQGVRQNGECKTNRHQLPRQVRFLAACRNGHLRDFPWMAWLVHKNQNRQCFSEADISAGFKRGDYRLRMVSKGVAGGAGVEVRLEDTENKVLLRTSLVGAFGGSPEPGDSETPLQKAGVICNGSNPILGIHEDHAECASCDAPLIVTLRGASNLYFPVTASAIHIPAQLPGEMREELKELFEDENLVSRLLKVVARSSDGILTENEANDFFCDAELRYSAVDFAEGELKAFTDAFNEVEPFRRLTSRSLLSEQIRQAANARHGSVTLQDLETILTRVCTPLFPQLDEWRTVPQALFEKVNSWLNDASSERSRDEVADIDSSIDSGIHSLREREYRVFGSGDFELEQRPRSLLKIRSPEITKYDRRFRGLFEYVGLIDSLREVRVIRGFDRLQSIQKSAEAYHDLLWREMPEKGQRWLPASIVFGEGIFLRFNNRRIREWEECHGQKHTVRLNPMNRNIQESRARRGQPEGTAVKPRQVLVHTFAHLLINQLIFSSGYGTAALRERLYVQDDCDGGEEMAGLLIYTAAGDSEGSMGGLVRQAQPGYLEKVVFDAIESAMWCASDPVCIESQGQGPDSCNLAACHSCGLLPETSCELMNRFLDRGTVIGTLDEPAIGYFSDLCGR